MRGRSCSYGKVLARVKAAESPTRRTRAASGSGGSANRRTGPALASAGGRATVPTTSTATAVTTAAEAVAQRARTPVSAPRRTGISTYLYETRETATVTASRRRTRGVPDSPVRPEVSTRYTGQCQR
jgi:hypothetical protein